MPNIVVISFSEKICQLLIIDTLTFKISESIDFNAVISFEESNNSPILQKLLDVTDLRAVLFLSFYCDYMKHYNIKKICKQFSDENQIQCLFMEGETTIITSAILAAIAEKNNVEPNVNDVISIVTAYPPSENQAGYQQFYTVIQEEDGLRILALANFNSVEENIKIGIRHYSPKHIFITFQHCPIEEDTKANAIYFESQLQTELYKLPIKEPRIIMVKENITKFCPQSYVINILHHLNEQRNKFATKLMAFHALCIIPASKSFKANINPLEDSFIIVEALDSLPAEKSFIMKTYDEDLLFFKWNESNIQFLEKKEPSDNKDEPVKVTLNVDLNGFYNFNVLKTDPEKIRLDGNELFIRGEYEEAIKKYLVAVEILDGMALKHERESPEYNELDLKKIPLYLNLAQCYICTENFYDAIKAAEEALKRDVQNEKGLFRKAKAQIAISNLDEAEKTLMELKTKHPESIKAVDEQLSILNSKRNEKDKADKKIYKSMFSSSQKD